MYFWNKEERFPTYTVEDPGSSRLSMAAAFIYLYYTFEGVGFILSIGETANFFVSWRKLFYHPTLNTAHDPYT